MDAVTVSPKYQVVIPKAVYFTSPIEGTDDLIVPMICLYAIFKKVNDDADEARALQAVAQMKQAISWTLPRMWRSAPRSSA